MFLYEFTLAVEINNCNWTTICNTCEQINIADDILNAGENVEEI